MLIRLPYNLTGTEINPMIIVYRGRIPAKTYDYIMVHFDYNFRSHRIYTSRRSVPIKASHAEIEGNALKEAIRGNN